MRTTRPRGQAGFTLLEMVIAIMVMSIAVLALMGALASMLQLSGEHRGHAVLSTGSHSFGQAVMASGQATTTLTADVSATSGLLPVSDSSLFRVDDHVSVDLETMRITKVSSATLEVDRAVNPGATGNGHLSGALVSRLLRCPQEADLTPPSGTFEVPPGVAAPTVVGVEYWDAAAGDFVPTSSASCGNSYDLICRGAVLAECGAGLYRAELRATTAGDARLRGLETSTYVLVRTGGS